MSVTHEQRAYHLRKMRTRMDRLDVNRDGYISHEDFGEIATRISAEAKLSTEQAKATPAALLSVADDIGLKPGERLNPAEAAERASRSLLSMSPEERKKIVDKGHNVLYDVIDTNNDGHISVREFEIYLNAIGPSISQEDIMRSFNAIDADKNGKISREEWITAAYDFLVGVETTEISEAFFGPLLP